MALLAAGDLDRKIMLLKRTDVQEQAYGTVTSTWEPLTALPLPAQVRDYLPSRGERVAEGINIAARPARIRIRYREDVTSDMRVVFNGRNLRIVAGPVELGRREGLEFVAEELSTEGQEA